MSRKSLSSNILTGANPAPLLTKPIKLLQRLSWACSSHPKGLTNSDLPSGGQNTYYFQTDTVLTYEHFCEYEVGKGGGGLFLVRKHQNVALHGGVDRVGKVGFGDIRTESNTNTLPSYISPCSC